jgi:hypothetical protein
MGSTSGSKAIIALLTSAGLLQVAFGDGLFWRLFPSAPAASSPQTPSTIHPLRVEVFGIQVNSDKLRSTLQLDNRGDRTESLRSVEVLFGPKRFGSPADLERGDLPEILTVQPHDSEIATIETHLDLEQFTAELSRGEKGLFPIFYRIDSSQSLNLGFDSMATECATLRLDKNGFTIAKRLERCTLPVDALSQNSDPSQDSH